MAPRAHHHLPLRSLCASWIDVINTQMDLQLSDEERAARDKELEELARARKLQADIDKSRAAAMENLRLLSCCPRREVHVQNSDITAACLEPCAILHLFFNFAAL